MKKIYFFGLMLLSGNLQAQSFASAVNYNKQQKPALMLSLPYSESISEDFIVSNLKKTGFNPETKGRLFWKQNKVDGYYIFKGVQLQGSERPLDLYFKVDPHSKKVKDQSIIYLMATTKDGHFISPTEDTAAFAAAQNFLNSFVSQSANYKLGVDITAQEEAVKAAENKLARLQEDEQALAKKIAALQKDLSDNKAAQEKQVKTVEAEKQKLSELKASPKSR